MEGQDNNQGAQNQNQPAQGQEQGQQQQAQAQTQQPQVPTKPVDPLPDQSSDRAKEQFEKLLESNRRLFETNELLRNQLEGRQQSQQVFDPLRQQQAPRQQGQATMEDFVEVNPVTGERYIDENRLKSRLSELNQKASKLETAMQSYMRAAEGRESERQNKEAFAAHPELDPYSQNFDQDFNKQVRGILIDAFNNPNDYGGRPLSFREAADYVRGQLGKVTQKAQASEQQQQAEVQQQQQAAEAQAKKEQASTQATSQPGNQARTSVDDEQELAELRHRTRYLNDDQALAERIKHTEHILTADAQQRES